MEKLKSFLADFGGITGLTRIGLQGFWLLLLYVVFSALVLFSLSAFQLQTEIRAYKTVGGKQLAIWQVLHKHTEWKAAKADLDAIETSIAELLKENIVRRTELVASQKSLIEDLQQCQRLLSDFQTKTTPPNFSINGPGYAEQDKCNDAYFNIFILTASAEDKKKEGVTELIQKIRDAIFKYNKTINYEKYLTVATLKAGDSVSELRKQKIEAIKAISTIANIDGDANTGIGDFLNSLTYLQDKETVQASYGILPNFSQMPPDMLTLILVMAMGALGGTLHLTRVYFLNRLNSNANTIEATASYYLFRPLLGAITALAVFILAKAGVLVITIQSGSTDASNLSPFFISFLGIISGLLAEQALDTIQGIGGRWFGNSAQADRPRWAFRLRELLQLTTTDITAMTPTDKQNLGKLGAALNVTEADLLAWIDEKTRVDPEYQKLIAAYLQKPTRDIFSDLPL